MRRLIVLDFFLIFSAAKGRGELKPRIVRQYRVAIIILSRLRRYIHTSFLLFPVVAGQHISCTMVGNMVDTLGNILHKKIGGFFFHLGRVGSFLDAWLLGPDKTELARGK